MTRSEFVFVVDFLGMVGLVGGLSVVPPGPIRDLLGWGAVVTILVASLVAVSVAATAPVNSSAKELHDAGMVVGVHSALGLALAVVSLLQPLLAPFAVIAGGVMVAAFAIGAIVLLARRGESPPTS